MQHVEYLIFSPTLLIKDYSVQNKQLLICKKMKISIINEAIQLVN
jgi:hypothetical protein